MMYYCSKGCQKRDWREHKHECKALTKVQTGEFVSQGSDSTLGEALLAARVLQLRVQEHPNWEKVSHLVYHEECMNETHHEAAQLVAALGLQPEGVSNEEVLQLFARFSSNNFGIVDDLLISIGAGVFPAGAMLNHSCDHNCAISYGLKTNEQIIRCIVAVEAGTELCHPYVELAAISTTRRKSLHDTYGFTCSCAR
jgi:SET and MYND domain-containing protein